jgi:hypothetical protein
MAFTGNYLCTSFKKELLEGLHDFNVGANTYKLALYDNNASPTTSGTTAFIDFADLTFSTATITARGALIYNSTNGNRTVCVLDFGSDKTSTAGDFTIVFPTADASNAIVRIA